MLWLEAKYLNAMTQRRKGRKDAKIYFSIDYSYIKSFLTEPFLLQYPPSESMKPTMHAQKEGSME
jgi:hypothetical protein